MIEETMSTTPIVFVLIILLFGFDSTGSGQDAAGTEGSRKKSQIF